MQIAVVVGLGNPGSKYTASRHNVGFRVVEELGRRLRVRLWLPRFHSRVAHRRGGNSLWLVKPSTYMNLSGVAVAAACRALKVAVEQCLVVSDDVELPLGTLRLRARGGAGAHNGLRSIVDAVGEGFPRLRVGIGVADPGAKLADFVLAPFEVGEREVVDEAVRRAADCVELALHAGLDRAASRFNASP